VHEETHLLDSISQIRTSQSIVLERPSQAPILGGVLL
jgi:hypothetical protein